MTDNQLKAMKFLESIGYAKPLEGGNWDLNFIVMLADIAKHLKLDRSHEKTTTDKKIRKQKAV